MSLTGYYWPDVTEEWSIPGEMKQRWRNFTLEKRSSANQWMKKKTPTSSTWYKLQHYGLISLFMELYKDSIWLMKTGGRNTLTIAISTFIGPGQFAEHR